jgi:hypothetical protein
MASTYEPIATTTLTGTASSVTFSSISGSYTDLILVSCDLTTSSTGNTHYIQFNSDTTAKYSNTWLYGTGSAAGSSRVTTSSGYNEIFIGSIQVGASATAPEVSIAHIMNYSNTTTYKTVLVRTGDASNEATANVGLWQSTSAINSIVVGRTGGTYASGSTFTLYGIKASA